MVSNMKSLLHTPSKAESFVNYMHNNHTNLMVFVRLFNMWTKLNVDERQQVYDICEYNHPSLYKDTFEEESDE